MESSEAHRTEAQTPASAGTPTRELTIVAHDIGSVGGMERQLSELLLGLAGKGYRVRVIARTCVLPAHPNIDFRRVHGPGRPFVIAYPWFMLAGSLITRFLRRGTVQATGAIVVNRVDVVAVHYCHHVGPVNPSRSSPVYALQVRAAGVLKRLGEKLCYRPSRARAFACVSEGVAEEMRHYFPRMAARVVTIHNGVDTGDFAPASQPRRAELRAELGIPPDALVAAFVGSEWERKGLEPAIRALGAETRWSIAVAGDGDRARFQALADGLGAGERVHWLGIRDDVQRVYQLADAFILPSSYETFSLVTFEAAASGLPILACPVSGVRELIEDGRNGFLIGRDPAMIAQRLGQLADDASLRRRLGEAARSSALAFSWERMVAEHEALYDRLAAGQPAQPATPPAPPDGTPRQRP
jgi:glycosyltransferase involved in cell wall biosynthesis